MLQQNTLQRSSVKARHGHYTLYQQYCKPKLASMLNSLKLDYAYEKAKGNYVFYKDDAGEEVPVLDLVGGFGATFLGHNNPRLKDVLKNSLDRDVPMFAQSAIRPVASRLAQKLNELIPSENTYYCNFSNSGAESVETAFKHAYKVRLDTISRKYEVITRGMQNIFHRINEEKIVIVLPDGATDILQFRDDINRHNQLQYEKFQKNPVFCSFKGAFHGKTTSALKVTWNKTFREGFEGLSAVEAIFIEPGSPMQLKDIVQEHAVHFKIPEVNGDKMVVKNYMMTTVTAMILEIVLGEGGVKPLSDQTLEKLATLHEELNIPFIIDEIQTGCGRTGAVFGYADTPLTSIEPEYVLLGKALGGGIVKIAVTMINAKVYDPDFGLLHTSTYAEDDISCTVALETLNILTENENSLLREAKSKGAYLRSQLLKLKDKYPQIVKDVRGKGLMTGLEFTDLSEYGPLFRYAGRQGFISLLVSSYLLQHHQIRISAPLATLFKGNPGEKRESVLRIQPPVFITKEETSKLTDALDEVFNIITSNNEFCLLAHLLDADVSETERQHPRSMPVLYPGSLPQPGFNARIGFIVHITAIKHLIDYYLPAFKAYSFEEAKLIKWWNKLCRFLEPDIMYKTLIKSGKTVVETNFICVPYFAKYMIKTYANAKIENSVDPFAKKQLTEMQDKIMDAVLLAKELGDERVPTSIVGLGAYTSIVTENGDTLNDFEIPVTTGNAYTTALMVQGILKASAMLKRDIRSAVIAVVGASGNIGSTVSAFLAFHGQKLVLIGSERSGSAERMKETITTCLKSILDEIKSQFLSADTPGKAELEGIAGEVYTHYVQPCFNDCTQYAGMKEVVAAIRSEAIEITDHHAEILEAAIIEKNPLKINPYFETNTLEALRRCDIVAIATNSPDGLINPGSVKKGAILCCASVPSNLSEAFKDHLHKFFVFDGGYAKLPKDNTISFVGMPADGFAYGCLSETLLMAFDEQKSSFAKNKITLKQVMKTMALAEKYGFEIGGFRLDHTT